MTAPGFEAVALGGEHQIWRGQLPAELRLDDRGFEDLWALHPDDFHQIKIHGRSVSTPRWQQAYGMDYQYTGSVNRALDVPAMLEPYLAWCRESFDHRLNGLLLNWYDAGLAHYIGKHRDSTANMLPGAPIVTISFGEQRVFRLRPWRQSGFVDVALPDGAVIVMPQETNQAWTHEVPHRQSYSGRRISLTVRGFGLTGAAAPA